MIYFISKKELLLENFILNFQTFLFRKKILSPYYEKKFKKVLKFQTSKNSLKKSK